MEDIKTLSVNIHHIGTAEINVVKYWFLTNNETASLIMQVTDQPSLLSFITSNAMKYIPFVIKNENDGIYLIFSFNAQDNILIKDVTLQDDVNGIPAITLEPRLDKNMENIVHNQLVFNFPDNILDIHEMISLLQSIDDEYGINDFREVLTDVPTEYTEMFIKSVLKEATDINVKSNGHKTMTECFQEVISSIKKKEELIYDVVQSYHEDPNRNIVREAVEETHPSYALTPEQQTIVDRYEAIRKEMKDAGIVTFHDSEDANSWAINGNNLPKDWEVMHSYEMNKNNRQRVLNLGDETPLARRISTDDIIGYCDLSDVFIVEAK